MLDISFSRPYTQFVEHWLVSIELDRVYRLARASLFFTSQQQKETQWLGKRREARGVTLQPLGPFSKPHRLTR